MSLINVVGDAVRRSATRALQLGRWRGVERSSRATRVVVDRFDAEFGIDLGLAAIRSRGVLRKVSSRSRSREGAGRCRGAAGTAGVDPRIGIAPPGRVPRRGGRRPDDEASRTAQRSVDAGPVAACHRDVPGVVGFGVLGHRTRQLPETRRSFGRCGRTACASSPTGIDTSGGSCTKHGGERAAYLPQEIVWFRHINPADEFLGMSSLSPARLAVDMGEEALSFNRSFLP